MPQDELTYDAGDTVQVSNAEREKARRDQADKRVLEQLMAGQEGRDWVFRFLERFHIYESCFSPGQADVTAFRLGEENIGKQFMLELMTTTPDLYVKMMSEAKIAEEARKARLEKRNKGKDEYAPESG
jgi:hypothetical protein